MDDSLNAYRNKRDFASTPEPAGRRARKRGNAYVIQKHAARRLHYDFRLELGGVLKSWAVPEGPSLVPGKKRLAVHVEDHPLEYGKFEGVIPKGEYGGGTVMIWDRGTWTPEGDPEFGYRKGHLKFRLDGEKLKGSWHLVRMAPKPREKQEAWLLFKSDDEAARPADGPDILEEQPRSAATGRDMDEIAREQDRLWSSKQGGEVRKSGKSSRARRKPVVDPSALPKAEPAALPTFVEPCLPSAADKAPSGKDWVHEIKYDGYRVQARINSGRVALLTRRGLDWTDRFAGIARAAAGMPVRTALIDGEIVVQTAAGAASFTALVDALRSGKDELALYAFDLLHLDGYDLREVPLGERKAALAKLVAAGPEDGRIRLSEHIAGDGDTIFRHASRLGLEGIVSKKLSAPYRSGRGTVWVKVKSTERDPFVVAGFVPSSVARNAVGALVLCEYVDGKLVPSGHVGSGFSAAAASDLWQKLDPLRRKTPPVRDETATAKGAKWVEPLLVAEIEYRGRTGAGLIRHASFRELVEGADAAEVVRPVRVTEPVREPAPEIRLTNPGRLLWPEQGVTKQGLAEFYTEIADWILPHIVGRPLSLLRCPEGVHAQCFFQKHRWAGLGKAVRLVDVPDDSEPMLAIDDLAGLLELVQASVLEIHPWGSNAEHPELPDRATIDLDPGDHVPWQQVIEAAFEVRRRLSDLGLQSFVKTTGGKGLHVVFPLTPKAGWDAVKAFTQSIAERMAADHPDRYTANMSKRERRGRIYVDYLRNGMGATAVAAYSTRGRPGAAVSTPLSWDEIGPAIAADHFTIENLPKRLTVLDRDPWEGMLTAQQALPETEQGAARPPARRGRAANQAPPVASENIQRLLPDAVVPSREQLETYWNEVAGNALEHLGRRPLTVVRHVGGITFYHQGPLPPVGEAVHQIRVDNRGGGEGVHPWVDSVEGLIGLLDIGVVELHPWGATIDDIERPDLLVFGLDPGEGVEWTFVIETASAIRGLLRKEGLDSWAKLTGGTGLDVVAPIEPDLDWDEARHYSKSIAEKLAATSTGPHVTAEGSRRQGRLVLNWQINRRGATAVGAYSPRALPRFPVAAPVSWRDLERGLRPNSFSIFRSPASGRTGRHG